MHNISITALRYIILPLSPKHFVPVAFSVSQLQIKHPFHDLRFQQTLLKIPSILALCYHNRISPSSSVQTRCFPGVYAQISVTQHFIYLFYRNFSFQSEIQCFNIINDDQLSYIIAEYKIINPDNIF